MAAADRFEITVRGTGGHAAQPHPASDVVLCAAQIITGAHTLVSRRIDAAANAVLSITRVEGGSAHNVMPSEVRLTGTVRTFDARVQDALETALRSWVELMARAGGCSVDLDYVRYYPATINNAACAQHVLDAARAVFGDAQAAEAPAATSEDFAYMLQQVPGAYIWLGSWAEGNSAPLHDPAFDFNDGILPIGATLLASLAERRLSI